MTSQSSSPDPPAAPPPSHWQRDQQIIEALATLNYRSGELDQYLQTIARSVCNLLEIDLTVVTLVQDQAFDRVIASSDGEEDLTVYDLHGTVTGSVVASGRSLVVEDVRLTQDFGSTPAGFLCYLGVPLRTAQGDTIGTICSFHGEPRAFLPEEIRTAELFAERAAAAIDNYRLYQLQQQFSDRLEAEVVKRTVELRAAQSRLIEQERLAAIGEFAATIVHEIRNPLTTVKMGLNHTQKLKLSATDKERLQLALDEARRLEELLNEILLFSKPHVIQPMAVEVNTLLEEVLTLIRETPEARGQRITLVPPSTVLYVVGDRNKLKQVLINLLNNACEASTAAGTADAAHAAAVVTCKADAMENDKVCISIHNEAPSIPPEQLPKLTQPFYSTKPGGTGLGLAIVKRIIDAHGGELHLESTAERGMLVRVELASIKK